MPTGPKGEKRLAEGRKGEPDGVQIAPQDVPAFVNRLRRVLQEQARIVKRRPNTDDAELAMVKRDGAVRC